IGDLATLLAWNTQDPADDFEMNRNNVVYNWQQNRNPFIDYPELASYVYGANFGQPWFATLSNQTVTSTEVKVYPNPTTDYLVISGINGTSKGKIIAITGQEVANFTVTNETRLPLNLSQGVYILQLTDSSNNVLNKRIVVK
ncbi:MAG: endonuclease, partial [Flavobacterium sp.]|nr:endonuclease [Flavobacterium sp.]